jgi:hypothetical protein
MALEIKKVEYFNIKVAGNAEEAYKLLSRFADAGVSLLAFKANPMENKRTLFSLFPDDSSRMEDEAKRAGLDMDGPYTALIIKSNSDEPGECADIFRKLSQVDINAFESTGIADIKDSYGVVLYLKQEDCEKALAVLKV